MLSHLIPDLNRQISDNVETPPIRAPRGCTSLQHPTPPSNTGFQTLALSLSHSKPNGLVRGTMGSGQLPTRATVLCRRNHPTRGKTHTLGTRLLCREPRPGPRFHLPLWVPPVLYQHKPLTALRKAAIGPDKTRSSVRASITDNTRRMGFDPQRSHRHRSTDVLYVGATIVAGVLLVAWALFW